MTEKDEGQPGSEVAVVTPSEVLERGQLPQAVASDVAEFVSGQFMEGADDPELIGLLLTAQILSAETPEEVLTSTEAEGVRQHLDEPMELHNLTFLRSEYEQGQPFYVVMRCTILETGEQIAVTTGSRRITAQAFQLDRRGWLPRKIVFRQAKKATKAGYFPLRMEEAN